MKERINRIKEKLNKIIRAGGRKSHGITHLPSEKIGSTSMQDFQGANDTKAVATARVANPFYDAFPSHFEPVTPDEDIKIINKIIVMVPLVGTKDSKTQLAIKTVTDNFKKNSGLELSVFPSLETGEKELNSLSMEIQGDPELAHLAVFIQDPKNKSLYWLRKIRVGSNLIKIRGEEIPYVIIEDQRMEAFERVPCLEQSLQDSVEYISRIEKESSKESPEQASIQASVGVARYNGEKDLSLDTILNLVALKYNQIRQDNHLQNP